MKEYCQWDQELRGRREMMVRSWERREGSSVGVVSGVGVGVGVVVAGCGVGCF